MKDHTSSLILKATALQKSFYHPVTVPILQGVDLEVSRGESVAIMGRSGEGKSTLLGILGTLDKPCGGTLQLVGQTVSSSNRNDLRNGHIGFIFQSFHLLEDYTAIENVLMPARIAREATHKNSPAFLRAMELLERVGLKERAFFHTKLLSGGEKQRVAIARALCNDPDILFADEPSGNLDAQNSRFIHDLLLNFVKENQKALVVVTHNQELADLCATRYALKSGILVSSS